MAKAFEIAPDESQRATEYIGGRQLTPEQISR
jgi:hypothetical protein